MNILGYFQSNVFAQHHKRVNKNEITGNAFPICLYTQMYKPDTKSATH